MKFRHLVSVATLAAISIMSAVSSASAADAAATANVNVRSGPGTSYGVVGVIMRGQIVNVGQCNPAGTWCYIEDRTISGWASASYLQSIPSAGSGSTQPVRPSTPNRPPVTPSQPSRPQPNHPFVPTPSFPSQPANPGWNQRPNQGPNQGWNNGSNQGWNNRPNHGSNSGPGSNNNSRDGQVCFYEEYDFRGSNLCVNVNDQSRSLERNWDNRIRSIRVEGNASATVCTDANFSGNCSVFERDSRNIGNMADKISSYRISRR